MRRVARWLGVVLLLGSCNRSPDPTGGALDRMLGPAREPVPPEVDETYDAFVDACRREDASALWVLLDARLRAQVDGRAADVRALATAWVLHERYGYDGHPAGFDGTAYLHGLLRAQDDSDPCLAPDLWRRVEAGEAAAGGFYVVAERPDGLQQGLRIVGAAQGWRIAELTRPLEP